MLLVKGHWDFDGNVPAGFKVQVEDMNTGAGYVTQTDIFTGRSLMRKVDEVASLSSGYEVLVDKNNSSEDMFETEKQSLHE